MKWREKKENKENKHASTVTVSRNPVSSTVGLSVLSPNVITLMIVPIVALGVYAAAVSLWDSRLVDYYIDEPLVDVPFVMKEWVEASSGKRLWSSYRSVR